MGKVMLSGIVEPLTKPIALPPVGTALEDMSWEDVRNISDAGKAADYFSIGDTKSLTINGTIGFVAFSNIAIDAFIIGIDHNTSVEGNGIHFQIGKIEGVDVAISNGYGSTSTANGNFTMNKSSSNSGGWASCHMRSTVLGSDSDPLSPTANTMLAALPAELLAVMKPMTKHTDNTGGGSNTASYVTATEDYLPLLAEFEVFGARSQANSAEQNYQEQYAYYAAGNSKVKYIHSSKTSATNWYLRSPVGARSDNFCVAGTTGMVGSVSAHSVYPIAPAFAV